MAFSFSGSGGNFFYEQFGFALLQLIDLEAVLKEFQFPEHVDEHGH
jgi:hypothetical protein